MSVSGFAQISSDKVVTQTPPEAAISPIEETIGLPVSLNSLSELVISSLAQTLPPGLLTLRTRALTFSSFIALRILLTMVSDPAILYVASPVVIAPSTLITAILFFETFSSSSIVERYS